MPKAKGETMEAAKQDEILLSLWKWKMLTMAGIHRLHFANHSPVTAYKEIARLRKHRLVRISGDIFGQRFVICLTRKGYRYLSDSLGMLRENGFESEHFDHDLITTAVHLGDWAHGVPGESALYTEQELRRHFHDHYPSWVPRSTIHRSDGYWLMNVAGVGRGTIALEVELSIKKETDYRICGWFYEDQPQIYRVVWVVRTLAAAEKVWRCVTEKRRKNFIPHNILLLRDYLDKGWMAPFILGPEKGKTLNWLLNGNEEKTEETICSNFLLDTRKSGSITGPCKKLSFSREIK
jgi:hypothetical protein